ncbi:MAG TPA: sulfotransferase [Solirubrobacteraceae bacterium]
MKLIGAGYGRTGTMSLKGALETLGAGPCLHMIDLLRDPALGRRWLPVAEGRPVDWHAVFAGYESTVDWPACVYYRELMEAFPEAKVLLNVRDFAGWHKSMLNTVYAIRRYKMRGEDPPFEGTEEAVSPTTWAVIGKTVWEPFVEGDFEDPEFVRPIWAAYQERVRADVPAEKLLVYELGDGWEPLAEFLGADVPDEPFPHHNDTTFFRRMVGLERAVERELAPLGRPAATR